MACTLFTYEDDINEWLEQRLVTGQSQTVWLRYAVESIYDANPFLNEIYGPCQYEERKKLIEAVVEREVKRRKNGIDNGG